MSVIKEMMHRDEGDEECESGKQENRMAGELERIRAQLSGDLADVS
jgi:hypothetical protein